MKYYIGFIIALLSLNASSSEIKCYNNGKVIYHGYVHDIYYTDEYVYFVEDKSNHVMVAFTNCLVKVKLKEKIYAVKKRKESEVHFGEHS